MKIYVKTYGCQMNERDSEAVTALLERCGYPRAATEDEADILIINTCSVRGKAEDKAIGKLGLLVATKRERPGRIVGAMGCMVQRLQGALFDRIPALDFAVGTHRLHQLPAILNGVLSGGTAVLEAGEDEARGEGLDHHPAGQFSTFINILFGCDRRCAYCIVPTVRGAEWSRPAAAILEEARHFVAQGGREITLLGQSVMSYGRKNTVWPTTHDSPGGFTEPLPRLLEAVSGIPAVRRIRFTSGHPAGCTPELARAMGTFPAVCEHLHLPMQSGSDRILQAMRRGYDAAGYEQAVACLREQVPQLALTTDVIVGFPGETVADFEATRHLMDVIGFDNAFIFKYSPRPGTPAAEWPDDVPDEEKRRRNQVLLEDQDRRGLAINEQLIGQTVEVLVEGVSLRNETRWAGRSRTNKIVIFERTTTVQPGDLVPVRIERAMAQTLYGTLTS